MAQESWKREQEAGCQQPDGPVLCAKNCGFFGSGATMNMCSKCYREHVLKQTQEAAKANAATAAAVVVASAKASSPQVTAPAQGHGVMPDPMDVDSSNGLKETSGDGAHGSPISSSLVGRPSPSQPSAQALPSVGEASRPASGIASGALAPAVASPAAKAAVPTLEEALTAVAAAGPPSSSTGPNRCAHCKKKVGLTGFKCRCNGVYCSAHRYSDKHNCSFDYKAAARSAIAKANPVVRADKIEKI